MNEENVKKVEPDVKHSSAPSISLPKGGGAIRGIGEKFSANPVTGTGSMTVPIATSPSRAGFGPQLTLNYDSGAGNGPFGFGWSLSLPAITRKTDKGLPKYLDAEESDVFILSGAEDLVPVLNADGSRYEDKKTYPSYIVHRYRPRIEGLFARIERWTNAKDSNDIHWRSISRDNILTIYGKDSGSQIVDPEDPGRTFSWLICETRDDKGNAVLYEYKPEDGTGIDLSSAHERNRGDGNDQRRTANRYLKYIRYGNRVPLLNNNGKRPRFLTETQVQNADWMFEVVFDYGEHDVDAPMPNDNGQWTYRDDPFSSYRAGFEVRTTRICKRVLMFHHFDGENGVGKDCLVRSTDFTYSHEVDTTNARNPIYTFLQKVTQSGYRRKDASYLKRSLPDVEFEYTKPTVQDVVEDVDPLSLENLPIGVDGVAYQWTDLHGESIPGILTEQAGTWFYKRNISPISENPVEFAPLEQVPIKPNLTLAGGQAQFMDLAGDGQPDLVVLDNPMPGLYEHDGEEGWQTFRPFTSRLNRGMRDPNLKIVDLDGDGHGDVLISEDDTFIWHASLAEAGFGPAHRVQQALDEEKGPRLVFADGTQSIYLADLSGDGLTDLVRIRNGEVCYWPNLGYCRFGAKITMDESPYFDYPDQFDYKRIRLADIDGTGTTDIIYLHSEGVRIYFNQSGNSWSKPQIISVFPHVDDLASITPTDLLGNGTACLVWSSPLPGDSQRQMRYVDLMGGQKPHLLIKTINNLGAETQVLYASSTKFYLQDKYDGKPWITRLPFPVHVIERVESYDHISSNRFVTRYAYHHGYFDGEEREFRGFGMVEQWDTEEFATLTADGALHTASNYDAATHIPPVHTKTWFHSGIYVGHNRISNFFAGLQDKSDHGEYYREPAWRDDDDEAKKRLLDDTLIPDGLTTEEEREACRALKGKMLRQEVYALDKSDKELHPYTVIEQNFTIQRLQQRADNHHAVFFTYARESLNYHYERNPADPRIGHTLTLDVDKYGNILKEVTIGYGRRTASADQTLTSEDRAKQTQRLITFTESVPTIEIDNVAKFPDDYRTPLPAETQTYELTGFKPENNAERFSFDEWMRQNFALLASAVVIPYEKKPDSNTRQKRLIEHVCIFYRKDNLIAFLPLGEIDPLALPGESYKLALTPGLIADIFKRKQENQPEEKLLPNPATLLEGTGIDQGGYFVMDGNWWIPSGQSFYDSGADINAPANTAAQELSTARKNFYLPRKMADPFGHSALVDYDKNNLLVTSTRDALSNTVTAINDYRVLQSVLVTDANSNRTAVSFDALGMVIATTVMGKESENTGDLLEGFVADPTLSDLQAFIAAPLTMAASMLGKATTRVIYDLDRFQRAGQPPFAATLARETHFHAPLPDSGLKIQVSFSYSDGFGREIQKKIQAEGGEAPKRKTNTLLPSGDIQPGDLVRDAQGKLVQIVTPQRWVGSGRTVFNNKGKPVKQYEPFFSTTHLFESEREMTDTGVSSILFYDPLERVVATLHPNHSYEKVSFDPWRQTTYDVNDTVAASGDQTGDPRTDPDIAGYVTGYFTSQPANWQTWYAQRINNLMGTAERDAALKAAGHADTPTVTYLDTLGRSFITITHNRYERNSVVIDEKNATRIELDIEGNQLSVRDAIKQNNDEQGRIVMRYDYDMLGNRIHQASLEAGERWMLNDVLGNPIRAWDSRLFLRRLTYDELRRPTGLYVIKNGIQYLAERTIYGESQGDANNHKGQIYQIYDGAGIVTNEAYDFKGNLLKSRRDLLDYKHSISKHSVNWLQNPATNDGSFTGSTTYDAINRPLTATSPDGSVYRPVFNEANLLDKVEVNLRGEKKPNGELKWTSFVTNINYNEKGQRESIAYQNGAITSYIYDEFTFRLTNLKTTRPPGLNGFSSQIFSNTGVIQDLYYTYDPVGNITRIEDTALKSVTHNSQQIKPVYSYTYDAIYRLTEAQGREHIGQNAFDFNPANGNFRDAPFVGHRAHPNDLQALRNYTERYEYDAVGNFDVLRHIANGGSWKRQYEYEEESLIEKNKQNNRLTRTMVGNGLNHIESFSHDAHGNMTTMPHLSSMEWDFEDQLQQIDLGGGGKAYYFYDASGQRVRKVIESQNGILQKERIYLGGFEIYRIHAGSHTGLVRESLHIMDDKQRIAMVETRKNVDDGSPVQLIRYQLGNHLGSSCVELDKDGALISYEEYHPYGTTAFQTGRSAAEVSLKRYRYTGKERDEESGFYYHGSRYYISWIGRWSSPDPTGLIDGTNIYSYVSNNPLKYNDPTGTELRVTANERKVIETYYGVGNVTFTPVGIWNKTYQVSVSNAGYRHIAQYVRETEGSPRFAQRLNRAIVNPFYRFPTLSSVNEVPGVSPRAEWIGQKYEGMRVPGDRGRGGNAMVIASPDDSGGMAGVGGFTVPTQRFDHTTKYHIRAVADMVFRKLPQLAQLALIAITIATPWPGDEEAAIAGTGASNLGRGASARGASRLSSIRVLPRPPGLTAQQIVNWERALVQAGERVAEANLKYGGEGIVNMAIGRQQALNRMQGLSAQVEKHLSKIATDPNSRAVAHWKTEIRAWLGEIERLSPHIGKKTSLEWESKVVQWKSLLGE
jgi:RHS repeat-associated protein